MLSFPLIHFCYLTQEQLVLNGEVSKSEIPLQKGIILVQNCHHPEAVLSFQQIAFPFCLSTCPSWRNKQEKSSEPPKLPAAPDKQSGSQSLGKEAPRGPLVPSLAWPKNTDPLAPFHFSLWTAPISDGSGTARRKSPHRAVSSAFQSSARFWLSGLEAAETKKDVFLTSPSAAALCSPLGEHSLLRS